MTTRRGVAYLRVGGDVTCGAGWMAVVRQTPRLFCRCYRSERLQPRFLFGRLNHALPRLAASTAPLVAESVESGSLLNADASSALHKLNLRRSLVAALNEAGIETLTEIQEKAIPSIRAVKDVLIASHTGSGKTYAYLLPIIERLKDEEEAENVLTPLRAKRPRVIVLAPSRELTDQILQVAKSISHHAKFCSMVLNAGGKMRIQKRNLALHQDLVVATPSKLLEHHSAGNLYFRDVQILVLDEADTLFDVTFQQELRRIIQICQNKDGHCQFILVAATITKSVRSLMKSTFPGLELIETDSLHKGVSGSLHKFIPLQPGQDKLHLLRDVMAAEAKKTQKIMVFCNTLSSCRCIEHSLQESGYATICYHGEVPKSERRGIIEQFSGMEHEGHVLVCTDLAARGLDIPGRVDHIINFDFPRTSVDYLHRSGRTARAGAKGKVTSLLTGKDRVLADRIEWAVSKGLPLDAITSNKRDPPPSPKARKNEKTLVSASKKISKRHSKNAVPRGGASKRGATRRT